MARGKSRGKSARKARRSAIANQLETYEKVPHSFVFHRGSIGRTLKRLVLDIRQVFEPFTAASLRPQKSNSLRDFVSIAGPLNVHFFIIFTKTDSGVYMKVARVPHGPTLTFRVVGYTLTADVLSALRKYNVQPSLYCQPPLLILNGLTGSANENGQEENDSHDRDRNNTTSEEQMDISVDGQGPTEPQAKRPSAMHFSLVTTIMQNLFAPLNVNKVKLDNVTRVSMFNYNKETNLFDFRHYRVKAVPLGLSRPIRKLLKKSVPDLSRFSDVADYVERGASYQTTSESEAELLNDEDAHVVLPTKLAGRGNEASHKSAIRLFDIGPRMSLQLVKIEDGLCNGAVLFHAFYEKTKSQLADIENRRHEKQRTKEERRRQQEQNVRRKRKQDVAEGRKRVRFGDADGEDEAAYEADGDEQDDDSDADNQQRSTRKLSNPRKRSYQQQRGSFKAAARPNTTKRSFGQKRIPKFRMQAGASNHS